MKILYVEDNPANISLLQRIARMGGHQVINYTNGEKALNNFKQDLPDLVLMDLQLEGRVSGLDVVKKLREQGFKTPIVAVTAYAMVGDRERCIEAGCDSYLSKPLPVAELVELVQKYELKFKEDAVVQPELVKETVDLPQPEEPTELRRESKREVPASAHVAPAPSSATHVDPAPSSPTHTDAKPSSATRVDSAPSSPTHTDAKPNGTTRVDPAPSSST